MSTVAISLDHNGLTYVAEIAVIESTSLGLGDHGVWRADLTCSAGSWVQTAGGYCLDTTPETPGGGRIGSAFGMDHIMAIVQTLGCSCWESVVGTRCFVLRHGSSHGVIAGIAALDGSKVLIFAEHAAAWRERQAV